MERYFGSDKVKPFPNAAVALGNFDGVHLGHRRIIAAAKETASRINGTSVVYTFEPHPVKILAPESCPPLIQTISQRLDAIAELGIDVCVVENFTHEFARQTPRQFFVDVLVGRIGARAIVAGYDFTFGYHRGGTVELLEELGRRHKVEIGIVEAQFSGEMLISSTEIRRFISAGNMEEAKLLLGRPFRIEGKVVSGKGWGGYLGAHTANVETQNELLPGNGVYMTVTHLTGGTKKDWPSVTSVGVNPTFPGGTFTIETHLIGFDGDIGGRTLSIDFFGKMRDQVAFASVEKLHEQILKDIEAARSWHEENGTL